LWETGFRKPAGPSSIVDAPTCYRGFMRNPWPLLPAFMLLACTCAEPEVKGTALRAEAPAPFAPRVDCTKLPDACNYVKTQSYVDDPMHRKMTYLCLAWAVACSAQPSPPPTPPPTPPPAVGGATGAGGSSPVPTTPEAKACANLAAIGCPEGQAVDCAEKMQLRCANPKVTCNTSCLIAASSKTVAQSCGLACGSTK
jgi:hypothetical protein